MVLTTVFCKVVRVLALRAKVFMDFCSNQPLAAGEAVASPETVADWVFEKAVSWRCSLGTSVPPRLKISMVSLTAATGRLAIVGA
jgi:hypothetical protein